MLAMARLKDYLVSDLATFFNLDEFAETHVINGVEMPAVIDDDIMKERPRQPMDLYNAANGVFIGQKVLYVRLSDIGERPVVGQHIDLDDDLYLVSDCSESMGILEITLEVNQA
jgi:hypothetical protein